MSLKTCSIEGCGRPHKARGWCNKHYKRWLRHGDPLAGGPFRAYGTLEERFWHHVKKTPSCWLWQGSAFNDTGYGFLKDNQKNIRAHRLSWRIHKGDLSEDIQIDHICHNRLCVNPDHLRPATMALNGQNRRGAYSNSTSGVRGVAWCSTYKKWIASATLNYKAHFLGRFDTIEEADEVVTEWRRENMPYSVMDQRIA